jgi:hypothetical protein
MPGIPVGALEAPGRVHIDSRRRMPRDQTLYKEVRMLGLEDAGVWSAYILCILSVIFCVIYGIANWNKGDEPVYPEDVKWVKDEKESGEKL